VRSAPSRQRPLAFANATAVAAIAAPCSAKEAIVFTARLLAKRVRAGLVKLPHDTKDECIFCYSTADGLAAVAAVDKRYPDRVATELLRGLVEGMRTEHGMTWRVATSDFSQKLSRLDATLTAAQDPAKIDKLTAVSDKLVEVKAVLQVTIEKVLERGELLDDLVERSADLSASAKKFYKATPKGWGCCVIV